MSLDDLFLEGEEKMEKAVNQLKKSFASIRTGRANPLVLDKVIVDYYGAPTPLRQMSQVQVQEGTTLVISPRFIVAEYRAYLKDSRKQEKF